MALTIARTERKGSPLEHDNVLLAKVSFCHSFHLLDCVKYRQQALKVTCYVHMSVYSISLLLDSASSFIFIIILFIYYYALVLYATVVLFQSFFWLSALNKQKVWTVGVWGVKAECFGWPFWFSPLIDIIHIWEENSVKLLRLSTLGQKIMFALFWFLSSLHICHTHHVSEDQRNFNITQR